MEETLDKAGIKTVSSGEKAKITGDGNIDETRPEQQEKTSSTRNADGTFKKGFSGNRGGAPRKNQSIVERFRGNEKAQSVINKLINVANTIDDPKPHKDAISACKMIVERLLPSLKASELRVDTDNDQGFVFLPNPEEPDKE